MNKKTDDNYISLEDAAEYLNIKPVTLRKWIKQEGRPSRIRLGAYGSSNAPNWMHG